MTIEIHKAELIEEVLDELQESASCSCNAAPLDERMGVDLIADLQASPHREQEIEPERFRLAMPLRDVTF